MTDVAPVEGDINPFAQFDSLRTSTAATPPGAPRIRATPKDDTSTPQENPFAQFDSLRGNGPPKSSSIGSIAKQVPTGFNETLADTLGAPVDLMTWGLNKTTSLGAKGIDAATRYVGDKLGVDVPAPAGSLSAQITGKSPFDAPMIKTPLGGSDSIKSAMGLIGADPRDEPANTTAEKIARGAGSGIAGMVAPEAIIGALGKVGAVTPQIVEGAGKVIGRSSGVGDVAASTAIGATGGAAGEGAAELAPEQFKPIARMAGSLAGGGVGLVGAQAARAVPPAVRGAKEFFAPMSEPGREAIAGRTLESRAENPTAVRDALDNAPREIVPGSKPTTFQLTGDMGLGSLERETATKSPSDFQQRRADQNTSRVDALQGIQPTGAPAEVSNALRGHLRNIDQMTTGAVERATTEAQARAQGLGGEGAPEAYGAALRGVLHDAENAARGHERSLWRAVDPDGTLTVGMRPVQSAAQRVYGDMTAAGQAGLTPTENTILRVMETYQPVESFRELADLRSAVSSALRNELVTSGRSPAYARLSQLRGAIEDSVSGAVEHRAGQEAQAVGRGEMAHDATMEARVRDWVSNFRSRQDAAVSGENASGNASRGGASAAGIPRTARQTDNGLGDPQGSPGGQVAPANFDAAARGRLTEATTATRERAQTFGQGPVGQTLKSQGMQGQYRMPDAAVAGTIFRAGPQGFETVQAFRHAADDPTALATLSDYVASRLRATASRPNGTLDPTKTTNWLRAHAEAMRAFPELQARFTDAASATRAIEDVAALRKDALEQYQSGALGKLVGATNDSDVTKIVGGIFGQGNSAQAMRQVAIEANQNPAAREGLRRAVIDYMYGRLVSNTEAATSGTNALKSDTFQTFIRQNQAALRHVMSGQEFNTVQAIAADLNRASRSLNAVRIPGQSNTAQDMAPDLARKLSSGPESLLTQIVVAGGGGYAAHGSTGALAGVTAALGKNVVSKMREAGMEQVGDLVKRAMLDPDLARALLAKVPPKATPQAAVTLAQQLKRLSLFETSEQRKK